MGALPLPHGILRYSKIFNLFFNWLILPSHLEKIEASKDQKSLLKKDFNWLLRLPLKIAHKYNMQNFVKVIHSHFTVFFFISAHIHHHHHHFIAAYIYFLYFYIFLFQKLNKKKKETKKRNSNCSNHKFVIVQVERFQVSIYEITSWKFVHRTTKFISFKILLRESSWVEFRV